MNNFQRAGSISNSHVGRAFEDCVQRLMAERDLELQRNHTVLCGLGGTKKEHAFDLGSEAPRVIVECKSHTWTASGNVPSAKMKNWAEAMFYFYMAPRDYRKLFVVERSTRAGQDESLLSYFCRTQTHLIPHDVELWEIDPDSNKLIIQGKTR